MTITVPRRVCEGTGQEGGRFTVGTAQRPGVTCPVCARDMTDKNRNGILPRHTRPVVDE